MGATVDSVDDVKVLLDEAAVEYERYLEIIKVANVTTEAVDTFPEFYSPASASLTLHFSAP